MTDNVTTFPGETKLDLDPDLILQDAIGACDGVVVCGVDKQGELLFASSFADAEKTLWWLRRAERALMQLADEETGL